MGGVVVQLKMVRCLEAGDDARASDHAVQREEYGAIGKGAVIFAV